MSMALMATASVSLTACHDDDPVDEPITIIQPGTDNSSIKFSEDLLNVKLGAENKVAIPVAESKGAIKAYSLDPHVAKIVNDNGVLMVEGVENGTCQIMVADENNVYKALNVSAYTHNEIELTAPTATGNALMGYDDEFSLKMVNVGNGGYTATTNNENVTFVSATDEGVLTFNAFGEKDPYTVEVKITDISGRTATVNLTVAPATNPFSSEDLENLCNRTAGAIYVNGVHDDHYLNEHQPYYFTNTSYVRDPNNWINTNADGTHTFGWELSAYGGFEAYGGFMVSYPETAQVGQEVQGSWKFAYSTNTWWPTHNYSGTVKVVRNDDRIQVVVCYGVNATRPVVDYAYVVWVK